MHQEGTKKVGSKTGDPNRRDTRSNRPAKEERNQKGVLFWQEEEIHNKHDRMCKLQQVLFGIGRSVAGVIHDFAMFGEDGLDLGPITKSIKNPKTPYKEKFIIRMDPGYMGIADELPGAIIKMNKKKPKNRDLSDQELEKNRRLNSKRVKVEHAIGRIKQYGLMTGPYENSDEQFHKEFNVITGLVNLDLLWDYRKKRPKLGF